MARRRPSRYNSSRRRNNRQVRRAAVLLVSVALIYFLAEYLLAHHRNSSINVPRDGNYEAVVTNPLLDEELVQYTGMTVSFNPSMHVANWVAYELTGDEADGNVPRAKHFYCDYDVYGCAEPSDYTNSGYDRGHLAPAADMKWSREAMEESFCMVNIVPQVKSLNRGSWGNLEDKCRNRARRDSAIVIVCGPILSDPITEYIGDSHVAVPKRFFKVVMSPYTNPPVAIGFIMPNGTVAGGMQACAVTVDSVEAVTGHDFFSVLPDEIEDEIESKVNFHKWSRMK